MRKTIFRLALLAVVVVFAMTACGPKTTPVPTAAPPVTQPPVTQPPVVQPTVTVPVAPQEFVFGLVMVGAKNDHGWSQAHYDAGLYVEQNIPGSRMIYLENVYSGSPAYTGTTTSQLAEQLVAQGAQLIIFNSDDMKDEATKFAQDHPDVPVIMASGDQVWQDGHAYLPIANMVNIMGRMEYGKMMAGCAAALTSQTGKIGYLGPLINDETRRLASSAYLGAKFCWVLAGKNPANLQFKVTWIGFWFYIPGFSSDPTQVADDFFNSGYDVVISGIDTTEAMTEAKRLHDGGQAVWAVPYDFKGACDQAPEICLGVPYFNWGPAYVKTIQSAIDGTFTSNFQWNGPDWADINNPDTSAIGFTEGPALSAAATTSLNNFIAILAGGGNLWTGPIDLQDGSVYLTADQVATDQQVWYLPQLLKGMEGLSAPQ
jgi:simple sugar transport system substrate-binding protein